MKRLIIFVIFVVLFASCSKKSNPVNQEPEPNPPTPPTVVNGLTLQPGAVQVTSSQMGNIQSISLNSITFSSVPSDISVGSVIFSDGVSSGAPRGFLRKVTSISGNALTTVNASLTDAFSDGNVSFSLLASSLQKVQGGTEGVKVKKVSKTEVTYNLDYLVYDADGNPNTTGDQVKIEGSISLGGSITGNVILSPSLSANASFNLNGSLDLNLIATGSLDYTTQKTLFTADGYPVILSGIAFTPSVSIVFIPSISLQGKAAAGITDDMNIGLSASYSGSWSAGKTFSNVFTAKPVEVNLNGELKGELLFNFTVYVYDLVGPQITIGPYARLDVNASQSPWWKLSAGAEGSLGVNSRWIASFLGEYSFPVFQTESIIAQAQAQQNHPPNVPSNPSPANYSSEVQNPVMLTWDDSDPDGDSVYYSITYQIGSNIPGWAHDLYAPYMGLGDLPPGTSVVWQVVAFDTHGDSAAGPTWQFTTSSSSGAQKTLTLQPGPSDGQDTWVKHLTWQSSPDTYYNYPDSDTLQALFDNPSWLEESESFIKFDLSGIPSGAKILSATLKMYGLGSVNYINEVPTFFIGKVGSSWDAQTVEWLSRPSSSVVLSEEVTQKMTSSWYEMDVTGTVQDWVNGSPNYGFSLSTSQNTCEVDFCSSNNPDASKRPMLVIIYQQ